MSVLTVGACFGLVILGFITGIFFWFFLHRLAWNFEPIRKMLLKQIRDEWPFDFYEAWRESQNER